MPIEIVGVFVWLVGLSVGSFLNVVIYRLPRDLSIAKPRWSFCPACRHVLAWYDNLPLLGWLQLGGRCRSCRAPISAQYPIVEAACGLAFVLVFHLLFIQPSRAGLATPDVATDWPILLAWLVLTAAMLACAGMDIVSYLVDTRITDVAVGLGIVCYFLWPRAEVLEPIGASPSAAAAVVALLVGIIRFWMQALPPPPGEHPSEPEPDAIAAPPPRVDRTASLIAILTLPAALLLFGALRGQQMLGQSLPAAIAGLALFALMVGAASQHREADSEVAEAIEEEASGARGVALSELLWLMPAILCAIAAYALVAWVEPVGQFWRSCAAWSPTGGLVPVAGVAYAMHGAVVGAATGWFVRIVFTLVFGKEAFGTGDIYILAAAGACGGWDIALLGFVLAIAIALTAWIVSLVIKRTALIAFGPPLALGFVAALWISRPAERLVSSYWQGAVVTWQRAPEMIWMLGGIMLVGCVVAVVIARLLRRLIEPAHTPESHS